MTKNENRTCPDDGTRLVPEPITYGDRPVVTIDRCPQCSGFWLDAGELEGIRDAISDDRDRAASENFASGLVIGMVFG